MDWELLRGFATALFIGALVGAERSHHQKVDSESLAGLRTFILLALLGALLDWLGGSVGSPLLFVAGLLGVAVVMASAYWAETRRPAAEPLGLTTTFAAILVYVLGAVAPHNPGLAVALAIVTAALLALKQALHQGIAKLSREELLAALRLLFASFIVLPLLPNHPLDPWGALNPYKLWLLVILISGLSMVGYVAVRVLGASKGTLLTGLFGGLVSSTAVTLTMARQSKERSAPDSALAAGVLLAWAVMFLRVLVLVGALSWTLLPQAALCMGLMGGAALATGLWGMWRNRGQQSGERGTLVELRNPFRLRAAIQFALLFAVILLLAKLTQRFAPDGGLYWLSAIAGSTDVDAILLSLLELRDSQGVAAVMVVRGIVIAAAANTAVKLGLLAFVGSRSLAIRLVPASLAIALAGVAALVYLGSS